MRVEGRGDGKLNAIALRASGLFSDGVLAPLREDERLPCAGKCVVSTEWWCTFSSITTESLGRGAERR